MPGVTLSGTIDSGPSSVRVAGSAAAAGTLRLGPHGELVGALGGRAVRLLQSPGATAGYCRRRCRVELPFPFSAGCCSWLLCASWTSSSAAAPLSYGPCANTAAFSCTTLAVPLVRDGSVPGTISLGVERKLAGAAPSRDAVVALAGGPGQEALPLGEFIAQAIAPALGSRDLLVFDQRGTGTSDPLHCAALEHFDGGQAAKLFEQCALEIGPARAGFTTQESVQDIEALRRAGGYEKLVLYGTSYGTKVALEYAERYPQHVEVAGARLGRAEHRPGTVLDRDLPGDRRRPRRALPKTGPAPASPPIRSTTSPTSPRSCISGRSAARSTTATASATRAS